MGKYLIFYDGNCALCKETKKIFSRLDWFHLTEWKSIQQIEKDGSYPLLNRKDLKNEMHVLTKGGNVYKGFFAVRRIFLSFPLTVIPGLLAHIPFMPLIGVPIYRYVAKNRHKFLKTQCKNGSCSI